MNESTLRVLVPLILLTALSSVLTTCSIVHLEKQLDFTKMYCGSKDD